MHGEKVAHRLLIDSSWLPKGGELDVTSRIRSADLGSRGIGVHRDGPMVGDEISRPRPLDASSSEVAPPPERASIIVPRYPRRLASPVSLRRRRAARRRSQ